MCSTGDVLLEVPRGKLKTIELFRHAWNPAEGNTTAAPKVARVGRERTNNGTLVCFHPQATGYEIQLTIMANVPSVLSLYDDAVERARFQPGVLLTLGGSLRPLDQLHAIYFRIHLTNQHEPERYLRTVLRRASKRFGDPKAVNAALYAAEFIAAMEDRGSTGLCHKQEDVTEFAAWTSRQTPLAPETITLARETIERILAKPRFNEVSAEGPTEIAPWRAVTSDLRRRLKIAEATRRTRARAPNAQRR
ncbi:MAG: hypothetical protein ACJ796_17380 [Gemmatimonadaceae bacterium]